MNDLLYDWNVTRLGFVNGKKMSYERFIDWLVDLACGQLMIPRWGGGWR